MEQEKKAASERNNLDQGGTKKSCQRSSRGSGRNGAVDCCPRLLLIFIVWNRTKTSIGAQRNILRNWKKLHQHEWQTGRNLVDFFIPDACHDC